MMMISMYHCHPQQMMMLLIKLPPARFQLRKQRPPFCSTFKCARSNLKYIGPCIQVGRSRNFLFMKNKPLEGIFSTSFKLGKGISLFSHCCQQTALRQPDQPTCILAGIRLCTTVGVSCYSDHLQHFQQWKVLNLMRI